MGRHRRGRVALLGSGLAGAGRVGEALPVGLGAEVRVVGLVELV